MKRPSKKEIRAAIEKLHEPHKGGPAEIEHNAAKPEAKKPNKNRIRKQGV